MSLVEPLVHVLLLLWRLSLVLKDFKPFSHPVADLSVFDVHEFDSNLTAVCISISLNEIF